jgi:hypothetical protein
MIDSLLAGLFDPVGVLVLWGLATIAGVAITRVLLRLVQGRNKRPALIASQTITGLTRTR